ncbi:MAG: hypothetical protein R3E54_06295 [Halioglobus sp.]
MARAIYCPLWSRQWRKTAGDTFSAELSAEQAYGERNPDGSSVCR